MDERSKIERKKNPREGVNFLSALTFTWVLRIFWVGYRRDLEIEDLSQALKEHSSGVLGDKLAASWNTECQNFEITKKSKRTNLNKSEQRTPSLLRAILKVFGARILFFGIILGLLEIIPMMLQPIALARLLHYFSSNDVTRHEAYLYAGAMLLCIAVNIFISHPYIMAMLHIGMKIRVACCSLIYRKALKLSKTALIETTVGEAVNLLSNDVSRFDSALIFLPDLWLSPLKAIIITCLMYQLLGMAAVYGVASLLMFIPLQGFLSKKLSILRFRTAIRTDERIRLTNEIIRGIQAIKMYTWENPFTNLVERARKREISVIRSSSYIRGVTASFMMFTSRLSLFVTVFIYVLGNEEITAEKIFMLSAYYNILRESMSIYFPFSITRVAEVCVSIKRIQNFLMCDEVSFHNLKDFQMNENTLIPEYCKEKEKNDVELQQVSHENNDESMILENVSARWTDTACEDTLKELNIKVKPGQLIAVIGQVGSGKSSLLNVLLRELPTTQGTMNLPKKIAYASQEPWLFAGSVRQNILFGRAMDPKKYEQVIKACQLKRDFIMLPYGDKTIVGDRGISLSGGQRARINLARAVYADAPLYLLDDPLSAVDAHVGKHMFEECIENYLKGRTRILVTHQIQFLRNVEKIIIMKEGRVETEGTYDELMKMSIDFGSYLESTTTDDAENRSLSSSHRSPRSSVRSLDSLIETIVNDKEPQEMAELRSKGSIGGYVYLSYLLAGGPYYLTFIPMFLFIIAQLSGSGSDYFISFWVNIEEKHSNVNGTTLNSTLTSTNSFDNVPMSRPTCAYIFTALIMLTIVITFLRNFAFFWLCMRASKRLHDRMFHSISRASMRFFNTNTTGRILNRFSKDMGAIDELLTSTLHDCIENGLIILGSIIVVSIMNPWLLLPAIVLGILLYFLRLIFLSTSRSILRLEGITKSPVLNHLSTTLQGLVTIRSFNAGPILTQEFDNHQDLNSSAWFILVSANRAFAYWLDLCCLVYISFVTASFLIFSGDDSTRSGDVGLAITQSLGLTGILQWGMRQSAELENNMTSVERVLEYTNVESEPPLASRPEKKPVDDWPQEGRIEFKNVCLTYDPSEPPVLKDLNFTIEPRERVGIVGRTGAGKSSLISALFRLADIKGKIEIDRVDVGEIGLHDFRSKISIIPQEPFLFAGTLRRNLDPFEQYGDSVLWAALEDVEMKEMDLESRISEGGNNLSVGQRQLICLARAIVRNNKILVLDEATANVDLRTDELIQRTIRQKFADCTVLTIAHRLNTVMDSDRILVMDAGRVVEFDTPHTLLCNTETRFLADLVQETGKTMSEVLTTIAKNTYKD